MEKNNKIFLIASADQATVKKFEMIVKQHVMPATIYTAIDGQEAMLKYRNVPPHVVIIDWILPKITGEKIIDIIIKDQAKAANVAILVHSNPPKKEQYVDEIVTGKIQFIDDAMTETDISKAMLKSLNYAFHGTKEEFFLRFLSPGDTLMKEGEAATHVYIVKKGQLRAFHPGDGKTLGLIGVGEFVGEMAYISHQNRTASVEAVDECELIEIPIGTFERILYKRPAWSKTLMINLAKRLQAANKTK